MTSNCNIASKTRKNSLPTPHDASKMLRRRFQSASKPDPTRPETARQPTRCSKKPQRWAEKSPRRLPDNPTRLRTTPQTRIRRSKLTPRCLGIVHEAERLTDRTQMKNTHAQPFQVFKSMRVTYCQATNWQKIWNTPHINTYTDAQGHPPLKKVLNSCTKWYAECAKCFVPQIRKNNT